MSQLNPNAAEFVPVSPTRSIPSPACRTLLNDPVIAQSPKRPSDIDISLPNPQEFEKEVKSRPSDFDAYSNGHDHEGDHKSPSQELMENLLNGKNIDEIPEFQPGTTSPSKVPSCDEFHFGPNAAPFTPAKLLDQSEAALSTKAVYGDESNLDSTFDSSLVSRDNVDFAVRNKEEDPMSMSFYQDKTEADQDLFDLNKVQMLPENLDDFLSKSDQTIPHDDTITDLPEHDPAKDLISDEVLLNNDERIQTTDLDKIVDDEKELASPVSNEEEEELICEILKSPNPPTEDLMNDLSKDAISDVCLRPESQSPRPQSKSPRPEAIKEDTEPVEEIARAESSEPQLLSPEPPTESPELETASPPVLSPAPEIASLPVLSPEPLAKSPAPEIVSPVPPQVSSPEPPTLSPAPQALSPEPQVVSPEPQALSFESQLTPEPQALSSTVLSPEPQILSPEPQTQSLEPQVLSPEAQILLPEPREPSPIAPAESPDIRVLSPEPSEELCMISKSPVPQPESPEPTGDVCILREPAPVQLVDITTTEPGSDFEQVCSFNLDERKETSVESPIEDVTSSVKDVASPITSPIPDQVVEETEVQLNYAQEINNAVEATVPVQSSSPFKEETIPEICLLSTPKSVADTESVATTDMNSFLERSQISDLASPLSPGEQPLYQDNGTLNLEHPLNKCVYPQATTTEIKTENIAPEFAEPAVITPTEQSKDDTPSVPSLEEEIVKESEVADKTLVAEAGVAAAVVVGVAAAAATAVAEKKTPAKSKTPTTAAKRTTAKPSAASPTKAAASPTKARAAPIARAKPAPLARTTAAKPTGAVPKQPISKAAPKPRTTTTTAKTASVEKKPPMANGDVKAPLKATPTARKSMEVPKTAASSRPSPTKPTSTRPTTAPAKTTTTKTTTPTTAPRTRPSTLVKTSTATGSRTVSSTTTTAAKATASKTATSPKTSPPKPRPTTAPAKPRVPLTKTVSKTSADTEKQNKDSANKLTASRTVSSTRTTASSARTVSSTVRKTEAKTSGTTRTTLAKTTTTTTKPGSAGKKPLEITRNGNKTKTTKIEKPVQNGVSTVVTEQITLVNNAVNESDPQLLKDNSPIDNKLIVETNAAD